MEFITLLILIAMGAYLVKSKDQNRRIALLGSHLGEHQIEKLMETLTEGYLRALGEPDVQRQEQVWQHLNTTEATLCAEFNLFSTEFAKVDEAATRVSKLGLIPYADQMFPSATFDLRKALIIHAKGIARAAANSQNKSPKDKAFTMMAELFLMQHTCHWFCRSHTVANARILVRHKTSHAKLVESVSPETRQAYCALTGM